MLIRGMGVFMGLGGGYWAWAGRVPRGLTGTKDRIGWFQSFLVLIVLRFIFYECVCLLLIFFVHLLAKRECGRRRMERKKG